MSELLLEKSKETAAIAAVDGYVEDGQVIGVGSGSTIRYAVKRLAERAKSENLKLICIPTSKETHKILELSGSLTISNLNAHPVIDVAIDGADEVDARMDMIKGGGGCLTQEKIIISCAKKVLIIADYRKDVKKFGESFKYVPVEVVPMARQVISKRIHDRFGGKCVVRSDATGHFITDNSNNIIDWFFDKEKDYDWNEVNNIISMMPGVVETGLFLQLAHKVFFGSADGSVSSRENSNLS